MKPIFLGDLPVSKNHPPTSPWEDFSFSRSIVPGISEYPHLQAGESPSFQSRQMSSHEFGVDESWVNLIDHEISPRQLRWRMRILEYHWYHMFWAHPYTWKPTIRWWNLFLCAAKSQIWQVKSFQYPIFCISEMICWLNSKESRKSIPISRRKCNTVLVYPRNLLTLGFRSTSFKNLGIKEPKLGVKHEK